jgi:hypothetical protein
VAALSVLPDDDEIDVTLGSKNALVFTVTGGQGIPTGVASAGQTLEGRIVNGLALFEFKPPANAASGDTYTLVFADSERKTLHRTRLRMVAGPKDLVTAPAKK